MNTAADDPCLRKFGYIKSSYTLPPPILHPQNRKSSDRDERLMHLGASRHNRAPPPLPKGPGDFRTTAVSMRSSSGSTPSRGRAAWIPDSLYEVRATVPARICSGRRATARRRWGRGRHSGRRRGAGSGGGEQAGSQQRGSAAFHGNRRRPRRLGRPRENVDFGCDFRVFKGYRLGGLTGI